MLDRLLVVLIVLVLTVLTGALLAGHGPWAGPVLVTFSPTHGLNQGDLPVLAAWLVGVWACLALWSRR